jgi:hypothetical protein
MKLKDQFEVEGLLLCKKIISEKKIDQLNNKIDLFKLKNKNFLQTNNLLKYNFLNRIINLHSLIHEMKDVYCEIRDKINIFNAHTTLWSSIYFEVGSEQPLHRDLPYFYTGNNLNESFGLWVALEDIYSNNGPLLGVKKSHLMDQSDLKKIRHKHFPNMNVPASDNNLFLEYNEDIREKCKNLEIIEYSNIPKGSVIVWHINTLHGGKVHIDKTLSRKSVVFHLTPKNKYVGHLNYFFQPEISLPQIEYDYDIYKNYLIKKNNIIDFAHIIQKNILELNY